MKNNTEAKELTRTLVNAENTNSSQESSNNGVSFHNEAEKQSRKADNLFRKYTIDGIGGGYQGL